MQNQIYLINKWCIFRSKNKMIELEKLRELIAQNDNRLIDIITKKVVNLKKIKFNWMKCRFKLETMMKKFKCFYVFLTYNVVDMQWHDLYKHMLDFELFQKDIDTKREKLTHRLLQKNSHVVAKYLNRRFQFFF
jgi:hypothetical protein